MSTNALVVDTPPAAPLDAATIERALVGGDLKQLTPAQRTSLVLKICESLGLNPWTRPFQYTELQGTLKLYATKDCAEQLRKIHNVSVLEVEDATLGEIHKVSVRVAMGDRYDRASAALFVGNLKGQDLANALMKCETKAKRRATLSICGLGMLEEGDVEDIKAIEPPPPPVRRSQKPLNAEVEMPPPALPTPTPTPAPPKTRGEKPAARVTDGLLITQTLYDNTPKNQPPFYEIRACTEGQTPAAYIFVTRDEDLYARAASAEGSPQPFRMTWHHGKRADGNPCKILDDLTAS